jgi:hypothetical protein
LAMEGLNAAEHQQHNNGHSPHHEYHSPPSHAPAPPGYPSRPLSSGLHPPYEPREASPVHHYAPYEQPLPSREIGQER